MENKTHHHRGEFPAMHVIDNGRQPALCWLPTYYGFLFDIIEKIFSDLKTHFFHGQHCTLCDAGRMFKIVFWGTEHRCNISGSILL